MIQADLPIQHENPAIVEPNITNVENPYEGMVTPAALTPEQENTTRESAKTHLTTLLDAHDRSRTHDLNVQENNDATHALVTLATNRHESGALLHLPLVLEETISALTKSDLGQTNTQRVLQAIEAIDPSLENAVVLEVVKARVLEAVTVSESKKEIKEHCDAIIMLLRATDLERPERRDIMRVAELNAMEYALKSDNADIRAVVADNLLELTRRLPTHSGEGHELTLAAYRSFRDLVTNTDAAGSTAVEHRLNAALGDVAIRLYGQFEKAPTLEGRSLLPGEETILWMGMPTSEPDQQKAEN